MKTGRIDIHNYQHRLRLVMDKVEKSKILKSNKKHIRSFFNHLTARGISAPCICKYIYELKNVAQPIFFISGVRKTT